MNNKISRIHIGTSGWSYKHWAGIFYPSEIKPAKYLEYYTGIFDCVELNSCFYHLPKESTIQGWMKRTTGSFIFCPKLSHFITHQKRLQDVEKPLNNFFSLFDKMKSRLGPVLIQLPPGLKYQKLIFEEFIDFLREHYNGYRFAVEVRHKSWISDDFFYTLNKFGVAYVIAHTDKRYPYHEVITTNMVYVRFHGPDRLYASAYSDSDLNTWAIKIAGWLRENKEVWAFFNNDFHGYAINNAKTLKDMVQSIY